MNDLEKVDRNAVRIVDISAKKNDFQFWQNQSYEFRLQTLEAIREEYHRWKYGSQPGFQRVYSVIKRT